MKVSIYSSWLAEALGHAAHGISASGTSANPVYGYIKLKAAGERMTITATDGTVTVTSSTKCEVEEEGEAVIPANLFIKLVATLPYGESKLQTDKAGKFQMVSNAILDMKLTCIDASRYPVPNDEAKLETIAMPAPALYEMMRKCIYAASKDEVGNPVLKNILLRFRNRDIIVAATNGRILSQVNIERDSRHDSLGTMDLLIPTVASNILYDTSMFGGEGDVAIRVPKDPEKRNYAIFEKGDVIMRTTLFAGVFPNYDKVIPARSAHPARIQRYDLLESVKRAAILSQSGEGGYVTLTFDKESLTIKSQESEAGAITDRIHAEYDGRKMSIPLASRYLIPILKSIDSDEIKIDIYGEDKPVMITCDIPFISLVMPLRTAKEA